MIKVQIINKGRQPLPTFATPQSAGMDLRANIDEAIVLHGASPGANGALYGFACRL